MSYVFAIIAGILAFLFLGNKRNSAKDQEFHREDQALSDALKERQAEAARQQGVADDLTKKFKEELRDYESGDGTPKP